MENWPLVMANTASVNCVIIGSGNSLPLIQHHTIICTNAGLLSTGLLGTNCRKILLEIQDAFEKLCHFIQASMRE